MVIRLGYDIRFEIGQPVPMVALLSVHPSRRDALKQPDQVRVSPNIATAEYYDAFGNICTRLLAPTGTLGLSNSVCIDDSGEPDPVNTAAREVPVQDLPEDVLQYLMPSR